MTVKRTSLRTERSLLRDDVTVVAGMDEVGRGALAGPVSVGVVAIDVRTTACPRGVADSKLLSPAARVALLPALGRWGLARAVGHASPTEIDELGIIAALRLAGRRALSEVCGQIGPVHAVVLDGKHDWLSSPVDLFSAGDDDGAGEPVVHTLVKADLTCSSVAAASILAKCARDALMVELHEQHAVYGWAENKGYGAPEHLAALAEHGVSVHHRRSWRLPGVDAADGALLRGVPARVEDGG